MKLLVVFMGVFKTAGSRGSLDTVRQEMCLFLLGTGGVLENLKFKGKFL